MGSCLPRINGIEIKSKPVRQEECGGIREWLESNAGVCGVDWDYTWDGRLMSLNPDKITYVSAVFMDKRSALQFKLVWG